MLPETLIRDCSLLSLYYSKGIPVCSGKACGAVKKDSSTPYIVHPFRVFLWLADEAKIYDEKVFSLARLATASFLCLK